MARRKKHSEKETHDRHPKQEGWFPWDEIPIDEEGLRAKSQKCIDLLNSYVLDNSSVFIDEIVRLAGEAGLDSEQSEDKGHKLSDGSHPTYYQWLLMGRKNGEHYSSLATELCQGGYWETAVQYLNKGMDAVSIAESRELIRLRDEIRIGNTLIGASPSLQENISDASRCDFDILIQGETGTGKEIVAKLIHKGSRRRKEPFIPINCASIPPDLIDSELYGHEKGAFTGASGRHIGIFETAQRGTAFLDEFGELNKLAQAKLLRFLQEREVRRVGSAKSIKVDVRVIVSTNKNLRKMVELDEFRSDLFYRIKSFPIYLQPLRENKEFIPRLIQHFIDKHKEDKGKQINIAESCMKILQSYSWPGNVRELENFLKVIINVSEDGNIEPHLLEKYLDTEEKHISLLIQAITNKWSEEILVKTYQEIIIAECKGNLTEASKILDVDRATIGRRIIRWRKVHIAHDDLDF